MNRRNFLPTLFFLLTTLALSATGLKGATPLADTNFVLVADPNNPADTTGLGSVSESFAIAKYDVTASEYQEFLEATEPGTLHGLYHDEMNRDQAVASLSRTQAEDGFHYAVLPGRGEFPIAYVAWPDAIRYCNWLAHGKPTRDQVTPETTENGAYTISPDISY